MDRLPADEDRNPLYYAYIMKKLLLILLFAAGCATGQEITVEDLTTTDDVTVGDDLSVTGISTLTGGLQSPGVASLTGSSPLILGSNGVDTTVTFQSTTPGTIVYSGSGTNIFTFNRPVAFSGGINGNPTFANLTVSGTTRLESTTLIPANNVGIDIGDGSTSGLIDLIRVNDIAANLPEFQYDQTNSRFNFEDGAAFDGTLETTGEIESLNSTTGVANSATWDAFTVTMQDNSSCVVDVQFWTTDTDEGAVWTQYHIYQGTSTQVVDTVTNNNHESPMFTISQIQSDLGTSSETIWRLTNASGGTLDFNVYVKVSSPTLSDVAITF